MKQRKKSSVQRGCTVVWNRPCTGTQFWSTQNWDYRIETVVLAKFYGEDANFNAVRYAETLKAMGHNVNKDIEVLGCLLP